MYDIHIQVQSLENVSPQLTVMDSQGDYYADNFPENIMSSLKYHSCAGYIGTPDRIIQEDDRYVAVFKYFF